MQSKGALICLTLLFALCGGQTVSAQKSIEPLNDQIYSTLYQTLAPAQIELGKKLFFDRRLSGDGTMSCATCHIPEMLFTDGEAISLSYPTTRNWRNAPTLVNLHYSRFLFHDGRSQSLEEQALFPILSAFEMNQNLDYLEEEIRSVPAYVEEFTLAFGSPDITRERIGAAIAVFEKTLVSKNSPVDRFLQGDSASLSAQSQLGMRIFVGKGKCIECHYGVTVSDDKFHALKVPENPVDQKDPRVSATRRFVAKMNGFTDFNLLDTDPGRYLITKQDADWQAFKTPTLREVAHTGPYMHNGIFQTLDEVIDFFDKGGGEGNSKLTPLYLTTAEKDALKSFLNSLSGEKIVFSFPLVP
nr:cytochrome-c peroxidase [Desulfobulbaceae bacterium]